MCNIWSSIEGYNFLNCMYLPSDCQASLAWGMRTLLFFFVLNGFDYHWPCENGVEGTGIFVGTVTSLAFLKVCQFLFIRGHKEIRRIQYFIKDNCLFNDHNIWLSIMITSSSRRGKTVSGEIDDLNKNVTRLGSKVFSLESNKAVSFEFPPP